MTEASYDIAEQMVDAAMSIDVTGSTIDSERLLEDARKLGIDFEDL